ncbi:EamA family transporter RarD [Roseivivax sp. CAU 1753]
MGAIQSGIAAMVLCCTIWGLSSIYYKLLSDVPTLEILAHRTFWSLVTFTVVLTLRGRLRELARALSDLGNVATILFAAMMISTNWFLFIRSIQTGRATEASLAYYIFPLVAVLLGMVAFKERMGFWQGVSVGLAAIAVLILSVQLGHPPIYALIMAVSFGFYGLAKKRLRIGPVVSVTSEVLLILPFSAGWLIKLHWFDGKGLFGKSWDTSILLALSGPLTSVPLILFSYASQRISLSSVGLIQYLNPTLQFLVAVLIFREPFGLVQAMAFALIWTALAIYSTATLRAESRRRKSVAAAAASSAI